MSKKITSPKIILFDCFETIVENDLNGWKSLFAEIIKKNHWNLDPLEFWNLWKKYEVNFREIRTNMEKIEESPHFITYEKAWKDCFDIVFRELNIDGNSKLCAELCINTVSYTHLTLPTSDLV